MSEVYGAISYERQQDIHDKMIELLEAEHCTVRTANEILTRVSKTIAGTASVKFVGRLTCEF